VDGLRDELFAGASFPFDQNRGIGWGNGPNLMQYSAESLARSYNAFKFSPAF
jgi:hypothetical protein